jgi:hypothetical protein
MRYTPELMPLEERVNPSACALGQIAETCCAILESAPLRGMPPGMESACGCTIWRICWPYAVGPVNIPPDEPALPAGWVAKPRKVKEDGWEGE